MLTCGPEVLSAGLLRMKWLVAGNYEQIDDAIRVHDKLVVVLSEDSIKSEWVKTEIADARSREIRENRRMLLPVSLTAYDKLVVRYRAGSIMAHESMGGDRMIKRTSVIYAMCPLPGSLPDWE